MPLALFTQDAFSEKAIKAITDETISSASSFARRPSAVMKKTDTFAHLSLITTIDGSAEHMTLLNSSTSTGFSRVNHNFFVTGMNIGFEERQQIVQTFGQNYVFFFGQQPTVMNISGFLMHGTNANFKNEFIYNYQTYLRGSQCVKNKARAYLYLDDVLAEGYLLTCQISQSSESPNVCQFTFNMLLTNYFDLTIKNANGTDYKTKTEYPDEVNDDEIYGNSNNFKKFQDDKVDVEKEIRDGTLQKVQSTNNPQGNTSPNSIPHLTLTDDQKSNKDKLKDLIIQEHAERNGVSIAEAIDAYNNGTTSFQKRGEYTKSMVDAMGFGTDVTNNIVEI